VDLKDLKELQKIIQFCRKNGITRLKEGEIEIDIAAVALFPESAYKRKQAEADNKDPVSETEYSEDDLLFWSSAGVPIQTNERPN
jgi:hypothetical protein